MTTPNKLPLWRLIAGLVVLGSFAAVIVFLTPVYLDDFRLYRYAKSLPAASDEVLTAEVVARAHDLNLPVRPGNVHIDRTGGRTKIELRYTVKMDLLVYPVDLHFPTLR
jgi:hypothetical protein